VGHFGAYRAHFSQAARGRCWQFSAKIAFFSKTNVTIKILHYLVWFWVKNANFRRIFRRKYSKNHSIGPRSPCRHLCLSIFDNPLSSLPSCDSDHDQQSWLLWIILKWMDGRKNCQNGFERFRNGFAWEENLSLQRWPGQNHILVNPRANPTYDR
jgi:hypothetical protein